MKLKNSWNITTEIIMRKAGLIRCYINLFVDKFFKAKRSKKYSIKRKYSESDLINRLQMLGHRSCFQGVWPVRGGGRGEKFNKKNDIIKKTF